MFLAGGFASNSSLWKAEPAQPEHMAFVEVEGDKKTAAQRLSDMMGGKKGIEAVTDAIGATMGVYDYFEEREAARAAEAAEAKSITDSLGGIFGSFAAEAMETYIAKYADDVAQVLADAVINLVEGRIIALKIAGENALAKQAAKLSAAAAEASESVTGAAEGAATGAMSMYDRIKAKADEFFSVDNLVATLGLGQQTAAAAAKIIEVVKETGTMIEDKIAAKFDEVIDVITEKIQEHTDSMANICNELQRRQLMEHEQLLLEYKSKEEQL